MTPLVFISHSSRDKVVADAICARLEQQGIRCWIAPRDIDPGRDYSDQIAEALERSTVMVIVFSSGSNRSRHVKSEIDRAFSLGQVIVPFRVENIEPEKGLAYYLSKTHWLDAVTPPLDRHLDRLAGTIRKLSGEDDGATTPAPAPMAPAPPRARRPSPAQWWAMAASVLLLAALASALAVRWGRETRSTVSAERWAGEWKIAEARAPDGREYAGTVQMTKDGALYEMTWKTGTRNLSGFALAEGDALCAGWGAGGFGIVLYRADDDGTFSGRWAVVGADTRTSVGSERASGGAVGKWEGRYTLRGVNPGGAAPYEGTLEITPAGETYRMQWNVNGQVTNGVGLKVGRHLCAVYTSEAAGAGMVGYRRDGAQLKGVWTFTGETRTGIENLIRPGREAD